MIGQPVLMVFHMMIGQFMMINNNSKKKYNMVYNEITKTDTYIELTADNGNKMLMPATAAIIVDDESGMTAIKTTGSRKTIGLVKER